MTNLDLKEVDAIVDSMGRSQSAIIPLLQAVQNRYHYLPESALHRICEITEITPSQILAVATFYSHFRMKPAGRHTVRVHIGTAYHIKGADTIFDE